MKPAIVLVAFLASGPALAVNSIPKGPFETAEESSPAGPSTIDLKHTQVIRCLDAKGKLILQGGPCLPTAAEVASAAAPEVIDLAALPPRPTAAVAAPVPQGREVGLFAKGALNGACKLGLLVLVCYGLWRIARVLHDRYRDSEVRVETPRRRARRVH